MYSKSAEQNKEYNNTASEASGRRGLPEIADKLEQLVLSGVFKPGEHLHEQRLADHFNVSRGSVREALRVLEATGIVEAHRNRGVFVRNVTLEEALHIYDVRAGLAYAAGRLLVLRVSLEQIEALQGTWEQLEACRLTGDGVAYFRLDRTFHNQLFRFTGNDKLRSLYGTLAKELHLFRRQALIFPEQMRISNEEHHAILDNLKARNIEATARSFESHILFGKQRTLEQLGSSGHL